MPRLATAFLAVLVLAAPAFAGIADTPLPVLVAGQTTLLLYSVPSIINIGSLGTYFGCTSTDTAPMQVGVEIFGAGGAPANDAAASSLAVQPGATVIFGTTGAAGFSIESTVGGPGGGGPGGGKGSARILATSKKLTCTAFVADFADNPPTTSWQLTIIAKTKQKAAN